MTLSVFSASVLTLTVLITVSSGVTASYFYNTGYNNEHHQLKHGRYYSNHHPTHHKHHQNNNHGKLHQVAVGVGSRGRFVPYPTTTTTTESPKLSPLDRLMNRLDEAERQSHYSHLKHMARYDKAKRHHESSYTGTRANRRHDPAMYSLLRASDDRKLTHSRPRTDDSYEDIDEEEEDNDEDYVVDQEFKDMDNEEDFNRDQRHHQNHQRHRNDHRGGHQIGGSSSDTLPEYDDVVADFPSHQRSGSGSDSDSGSGISTYSDLKWRVLNKPNIDAIRDTRRNDTSGRHSSTHLDLTKAYTHAMLVNKETCHIPKPRLISVKNTYPHPSKNYYPHCAMLHQCGDDIGCCRLDTQTCTVKSSEPVELYFFTTTVDNSTESGSRGALEGSLEKLIFYNHTECKCVNRSVMMPRDRSSNVKELDSLGRSGFRGYYLPDKHTNSEDNTCRCPSQFSARRLPDGECLCDCFDKQRDCLRKKRGKEYLHLSDHLCVIRGSCTSPSCEFGSYLRKLRRCPTKQDKFDSWRLPLNDEDK